MGVRFETAAHLQRLAEIQKKTLFACQTYGKAAAMKMVKEAQKGHKWADHSHHAKNSINGGAEAQTLHKISIRLSMGANYGVFLELKNFKHKGRLAILFPTVKKMAPEVLAGWAEVVKRGGG